MRLLGFALLVLLFGCSDPPTESAQLPPSSPRQWFLQAESEDLLPRPPNPTPSPWITAAGPHQGFSDEPALAVTDSGDVYAGWISFRNGADTLQVARYSHTEDRFKQNGSWQLIGGKDVYLLGLRAVSAAERVFFVYAREIDGDWNIFAAAVGAAGPETPVRIASGPQIQIKPAAAWHDGILWVSWESNRDGRRAIYLASLHSGEPSEPELVTPDAASNYAPAIAIASNGLLSVAWHSFRDDNYDVYLRQRDASGDWSDTRRLTQSPGIDRHASLLTHNDDLWLVYEHARMESYYIGRTDDRHILVAKVTARGLESPRDYLEESPLAKNRAEAATAIFDSLGRLWISYQQPREPRGGWAVHLVCYTGEEWVGNRRISQRRSLDRPVPLALMGDRILAAFQADEFSDSWSQGDPEQTAGARSKILLASIDTAQAPTAPAMRLAALVEPGDSFEAGRLRHEFGEDAETPSIDYDGETYYLYHGDLHEHSDISICNRCGDQSLDENYQCRRDINRLDFAAMTDHGYNIVPYLWSYSGKLVRTNHDPGRLVTFLAEEWTSSFEDYDEKRPWGYYGHRNLIFADPYFPKWWISNNGDTPSDLWAELRAMKANFVQIPHQLADSGNVPTDWDYTDEEAQPVAEIYQTRGSYEYPGAPLHAARATGVRGNYLQDAWARGIKIGVIASPDHGGGVGKASVWARAKTREAILDAIRNRRTFGTTAPRLMMDFRVNDKLMGEVIEAEGPVRVRANVSSPSPIAKVEICRNNEFIYTIEPEEKTAAIEFLDQTPLDGSSYYYLRVILENEEIGWSSPVWRE